MGQYFKNIFDNRIFLNYYNYYRHSIIFQLIIDLCLKVKRFKIKIKYLNKFYQIYNK